jgi:arylsulfatase
MGERGPRREPISIPRMWGSGTCDGVCENLRGHGLMACGNGGNMWNAMHFGEEWTGRFRRDRKSLPAIALSDPSQITCGPGVIAAFLLLWGTAACGGGESPKPGMSESAPRTFERIALEPFATSEPLEEALEPLVLWPGLEPDAWHADAARSGPLRLPESPPDVPPALILEGAGPKRLARELEGEQGSVDTVVLTLSSVGLQVLQVELRHGERTVATSPEREVLRAAAPARVSLELEWQDGGPVPWDQLVLSFHGPAQRVGVLSVELLRNPSAAQTSPEPFGELVLHEDAARRGAWVSRERGLRGRVQAGERSEIAFAWRLPNTARPEPSSALLARFADDAGHEQVQRIPLGGERGKRGWQQARFPLQEALHGALEVRFMLDGAIGCFVSEIGISRPAPTPRPSVLLVSSDTHRADHLGVAQSGIEVRTPAIDALAGRGVIFTECSSPSNVTLPSHVALLTGIHPRDTGVQDNLTSLAESATTLAERFRDAGYRTWALVSVRHLRPEVGGLGQGFDRMLSPPSDKLQSDAIAAAAERWLAEAPPEPLFLFVHVYDAHAPYEPPGEFDRMYYSPGADPFDPSLPEPPVPEGPPERHPGLRSLPGLRDLDFPRAQYRAEISYQDEQLAPLLDHPAFREGVIAFVSDHGESLGDNDIYFDHAGLYPGTLHVPLILAWPGAPAGTRVSMPVMHTDLARTLLDAAGLRHVAFPGRDLRSVLAGGEAIEEQPRFSIAAHAWQAAVRIGTHHMILHLRESPERAPYPHRSKHEVELYDLSGDPHCERNLVDEKPERARRMRALLVEWLQDARPLGLRGEASDNPELLASLARLGYVVDDSGSGDPRASLCKDDDCEWCRRFR